MYVNKENAERKQKNVAEQQQMLKKKGKTTKKLEREDKGSNFVERNCASRPIMHFLSSFMFIW